MTTEERPERIEHITAGLAEQHRQDRETDRQLWRDTQRQINELSARVVQMGDELREADRRLEARIEQLAQESRAEGHRLDDRIDKLVSAIGQLAALLPARPPQ